MQPNGVGNESLDAKTIWALKKGRKDIVFFAWYFLGLKLHPGQIRFLRQADGQVNILVPGNRFGKTIIIVVRHIWFNFYKIGFNDSRGEAWQKAKYRSAALAPDSKILTLDYNTLMDVMQGRFVISQKGDPIVTNTNRISWFLLKDSCRTTPMPFVQFRDNAGIQFYSTSEDKGGGTQGEHFGYGSYDEGGRSYHLETEINQNLGPRFSELNAPLDIVSTPYMDSPSLVYHHEIYQKGLRHEGGYRSFEGSAYENVYLPKWYFEREEERLAGRPERDQVLDGKFVFSGDTFYKQVDIEQAITKDLNGGVRYEKDHHYVISTDTAVGRDEQVDTVVDIPDGFDIKDPNTPHIRVVRQTGFKGSSKSPQLAMQEHIDLWEAYDKDRNVTGMLETFSEGSVRWYYDLPDGIRRRTKAYGSALQKNNKAAKVTTNGGKKVDMLLALRKCLTAGVIDIPEDNKELIQQLIMYRENDTRLSTDRIISLALACWYVLEGKPVNTVARAVSINW